MSPPERCPLITTFAADSVTVGYLSQRSPSLKPSRVMLAADFGDWTKQFSHTSLITGVGQCIPLR